MALTEYLILLALLSAGVIGSARLFGVALGEKWDDWAGFYDQLAPDWAKEPEASAAVIPASSEPEPEQEQTNNTDPGSPAEEPVSKRCSSARGAQASHGQSLVSCD